MLAIDHFAAAAIADALTKAEKPSERPEKDGGSTGLARCGASTRRP